MTKISWQRKVVVSLSITWILLDVHGTLHGAQSTGKRAAKLPDLILISIIKAEDERRWDAQLGKWLNHPNPLVRSRAALAAGRIGDDSAVVPLIQLLRNERNDEVRSMLAFALGETESPQALEALLGAIQSDGPAEVRARIMEALGKIAGALPRREAARKQQIGDAILRVLRSEVARRQPARNVILLGLTAALRAAPPAAGPVVAGFLASRDPRVRGDAANVLARLRLNDGNSQLRRLLNNDPDPIVRANAARVMGATEDKDSFKSLLDRALTDSDSRVRVSAIRSLAALKNPAAVPPLIQSAMRLKERNSLRSSEDLEIATTIGQLMRATANNLALSWLRKAHDEFGAAAPEVEIALARVSPAEYLATLGEGSTARRKAVESILVNWHAGSSIAQGLGELAALTAPSGPAATIRTEAESILRSMLDYRNSDIKINTLVRVYSEYAIPDVLRSLAAFKPADLAAVLRNQLKESDVIVRATAAELIGTLPADEQNGNALIAALSVALADSDLNDAALAILDALAKQRSANDAIKSALRSRDYLIRRRAVALLKENGVGDFSKEIGFVETQNKLSDYRRAVLRFSKAVQAIVTTSRGSFTLRLLAEQAPLNVDNFIQLSRKGYFNGIAFHRVVPNFVIQGGDPRGDGNGGPGYQIRCEINQESYERGTVGMALSGKDTGGSQWFVTHSPQPHLDGGYTVFGRVIAGMDVVDSITRGDVISSITVKEAGKR